MERLHRAMERFKGDDQRRPTPVIVKTASPRLGKDAVKDRPDPLAIALSVQPGWVNGLPGLVVTIDDHADWVAAFDVRDGLVDHFYVMLNPDKLASVDHHVDLV